jgi:hypothetical protein
MLGGLKEAVVTTAARSNFRRPVACEASRTFELPITLAAIDGAG